VPGLFGILRKSARLPADRLRWLAGRMSAALETAPGLAREASLGDVYCGGRVHAGALNPDCQPLTSGKRLVWFDGQIYPDPAQPGRTATADEVVRLLEDSTRPLAQLDGVFALAAFDPEVGELALTTDRLGFRPLYWTETADWFAYAPEVKALLALLDRTPPVDEIALRQFFGFDHLLGDRTWWSGIELVPPACVWRISAGYRRSGRYWTFDEIPQVRMPEAQVVEELEERWPRAVRQRRKPGLTPLLLSGGLDSRALLAELRYQRAPVATFTFGVPECPDIVIARRCARLAGVAHRTLEFDAATWWHGRDACIAQTDGLINAMHLHVAIAREAMSIGNRTTLQHIAGDSLFGGSYLSDHYVPPSARTNWKDASRNILSQYYRPNPIFSRDDVVAASSDDAARYLEGPTPDCFFYRQRQRRFILYGALALAPHCEVTYPGVSLPLLDLLLGATSPDDRRESRLHARFLLTRYREYVADVPWQATGRGLSEPPIRRLGRALNRIRARLLHQAAPSLTAPFIDYRESVRASGLLEKLRRPGLLVEDVLPDGPRTALATEPVDANAVLGIATLETYLRQTAGVPGL
jgi:asparagine synthase (glutamine-hydrolysing)